MTALYTITEQFKELAALAETADEDLAVALRDTMEGIEGEFQEKGKAIAMVTLNIDGDLEAIQSQIERLTERKRIITNRKESLKEYLRTNMEASGITKITHPLFTITCGKGKPIVVIDDEKAIPDDFVNVKVTSAPDKAAIAKAIKEGKEVPGAHTEIGKSSISIK
ncbi:viral Gp157 protein [Pseudomonas sp. SJZ085]|uniref:siphovirus Gp157 family protein n=1 Tax=unclassified Pseudomonas TaxID=196821 RepID=UPI001199F373|nr:MULTISPECIES: siphovirus Gp157 family protein [unclassified Pseudomonas]TWC17126.1 viral Gp157 protein [Pseudomonas sp. SJZ074]TWC35120.1 viral Gp157 protein [Pseudomonas sp. SJZ085]